MDDADRTHAAARLEEIFRSHHRAVAAYVARRAGPDAVDDVVAETFLVAWRRLDEVAGDALPWLIGVARNILATQRRAAQRRLSLRTKLEGWHPRPALSDDPDERGVGEALASLSETDREAITLVAWDGLTPRQAAAVLGQAPSAFRVRLHRAKQRLRRKLEQYDLESERDFVPNEVALIRRSTK